MKNVAKKLSNSEDHWVAAYAVATLQRMPGIREVETQHAMECVAWLHCVDLDDLHSAEQLGLPSDYDFKNVFVGVKLVQRQDWQEVNHYLLRLYEALDWHKVVGVCVHLAKLRQARLTDKKKRRRQLWGETKYQWLPWISRLLSQPYGGWLTDQLENELSKG